MIKKIRRKKIVIKQKEVFTVNNGNEIKQTCPVCHTTFPMISEREQKQLPATKIADENKCS